MTEALDAPPSIRVESRLPGDWWNVPIRLENGQVLTALFGTKEEALTFLDWVDGRNARRRG